jgi:two-component system cell cycle sensor histidine kinase/response regulator CckA
MRWTALLPAPPEFAPSPRRHSLRWRLPVLVSVLVLTVLATFLWAAHREVERSLVQAAGERAQTSADQVAALLGLDFKERFAAVDRAATGPALRRFLQNPIADNRAPAEQHLRALGVIVRADLWSDGGERLLTIFGAATADPGAVDRPMPATAGMTIFGVGDRVLTDRVSLVFGEPQAGTDRRGEPRRRGYLVVRQRLMLTPPDVLSRLVGSGAVLIGPKAGGDWTDFATILTPPRIDISQRRGVTEYRKADGEVHVGALSELSGTPWSTWVEFPRAPAIAPARAFLLRMTGIAALFVVLSVVIASALMRGVTTPLLELSRAAESIAAGDYTRRATIDGQAETGRLATAFNVMARHVDEGHRQLEAQVRESRDALEALKESEMRHRAIVEVALDCIITIDASGTVMEFNPAAERTFGYQKADAVGRQLSDLIVPPSLRAAHRRGLARYAATGEGRIIGTTIELTGMRSDGSEFPVEMALTPIRSAGELMIAGVLRDITQRKRAAEALLESERAYRLTFDEAPVGIAQASLEGRLLRVNARLRALLGLGSDDPLSVDLAALTHPDEREQEREDRRRLLAGAVDQVTREGRLVLPGDRLVRVNLTLSLQRDSAGTPAYFIAIIEDVSARYLLQEQLRQAHKMEAVGRLAGGVAHDFNNLLTAILGFSTMVLEDLPEDHPSRNALLEIKHAGESAASLTRQLLAFSRQQILQLEVLDLNSVVQRMDALLQRVLGEDVALVAQLAPTLGRINGDAAQIEQIILNLAINARDAMPEGGKLTIETGNVLLDEGHTTRHRGSRPGPHAMLAVSDTGIGMSADVQAQVFEPFFTTKRRGEGTGLGLATVYGIVKQMGGWIWVYSEPGLGTTFKVYFPITAQEANAAAAVPQAPAFSLEGVETILLAEDQAEVRSVATAALRRHGYSVLEAGSGEQAIQIARETRTPIDLLITDVVMPAMSGRQLAELLRVESPGIPVLYTSGYADDAIVRHGVLEAGVAFLPKPFTPQALLVKVREVLDASQPQAAAALVAPTRPRRS